MFNIYEFYQKLEKRNVVLAYKGNTSDKLFDCLLEMAEEKLHEIEYSTKLKRKVFNILVEILQNIYHHADDFPTDDEDYYSVVFLLMRVKNGYRIVTGNHVGKDKIPELKKKIDSINSLSEEELKHVFREQLDVGEITQKGGAGLGMLDIVRKSGEKIEYQIKKVDEKFTFFSLQVEVLGTNE